MGDVMGLTLTDEVTKSITDLMEQTDTDSDGKISKEEFLSDSLLQLKSKSSIRDAPGEAEFAHADKDGDGFLSAEELTSYAKDVADLTLTDDEPFKELTELVKQADTDGDGKISKEEVEKIFAR